MTSGDNNFNYFPENQVIKFSAVDLLQFKHSEKNEDVLFRGSAVLFCRAVSSSHRSIGVRTRTPHFLEWGVPYPPLFWRVIEKITATFPHPALT